MSASVQLRPPRRHQYPGRRRRCRSVCDESEYQNSAIISFTDAHSSCNEALDDGPSIPQSPGAYSAGVTLEKTDDSVFNFLYGLIFALVHFTLTTVMSPVLSKNSSHRATTMHLAPPRQEVDLEIAHASSDDSSCASSRCSERRVRFERRYVSPKPHSHERSRPPLGRVGVSSGSSICSLSSCESSVSSSSSVNSVSHCSGRDSRLNSVYGKHPIERIRVAPRNRAQERAHHTTCFVRP